MAHRVSTPSCVLEAARLSQARRAPDARSRAGRSSTAALPSDDGRRTRRSRSRSGAARSSPPAAPDQKWFGDITYIRTWEGWLYLAVILDAYSRKVVGWAMADHLRTELATAALQMALTTRRPEAWADPSHDRGVQYTSAAYGELLDGSPGAPERRPAGHVLGQRRGRELLRHAQD